MFDHSAVSDEDYLAAFLECRMAAEAFDHRGHVRVAWLLLRRYPTDVAVAYMCDGIARLAAQFDAPQKYHRTITEALVRLMAHSGATNPSLTWEAFVQANTRLMTDVRGLLSDYYSAEVLSSREARVQFLPPNRQPLPIQVI